MTMISKPSKPSNLNARGTSTDGSKYWQYHAWFMAYNDPNSTDYPVVAYLCDSWNADPKSEESGIMILSFKSKEEYENWTNGDVPNPDNSAPIDPEDADEDVETGLTLITACNFD